MRKFSGLRRLESLWLVIESSTQPDTLSAGLYQRDVSNTSSQKKNCHFKRLQRLEDRDLSSLKEALDRHAMRTTHPERMAVYWITFRYSPSPLTDSPQAPAHWITQENGNLLYATQSTLQSMATLGREVELLDVAVLGSDTQTGAYGTPTPPEHINLNPRSFSWVCIPASLHPHLMDIQDKPFGWLKASLKYAFGQYQRSVTAAYCLISVFFGLCSGAALYVLTDELNQPPGITGHMQPARGTEQAFHDLQPLDTLMTNVSTVTKQQNIQWNGSQIIHTGASLQLHLIARETLPEMSSRWPQGCRQLGSHHVRCDVR